MAVCFPVKCRGREGQNLTGHKACKSRSRVKRNCVVFSVNCFTTLRLAVSGSTYSISFKSHQHRGLHKICIAWQGLLKVYPGQIPFSLINLTHFKNPSLLIFRWYLKFRLVLLSTERHGCCFACNTVESPLYYPFFASLEVSVAQHAAAM